MAGELPDHCHDHQRGGERTGEFPSLFSSLPWVSTSNFWFENKTLIHALGTEQMHSLLARAGQLQGLREDFGVLSEGDYQAPLCAEGVCGEQGLRRCSTYFCYCFFLYLHLCVCFAFRPKRRNGGPYSNITSRHGLTMVCHMTREQCWASCKTSICSRRNWVMRD